ncbi:MAG: YdcF family protein [Thermoanaerobaculia bacterium]|nr:YdcF family protein [Thermoanaerobaculia bacterium]
MRFSPAFKWLAPAVLLTFLNACSFSSKSSLRQLKKAAGESPYDMIVVPGVPFEDSTWSQVMKIRVLWSKYLYDRGIAKNVMYSGSAVYTPYYEAQIMAMYGEALGIPKDNIYTETKAEHSTENIYYSYKKAKKLGFKRIALASDPFQTKMLRRFTRKIVSREVGMLPMVFDTIRAMESRITEPAIDFHRAFKTAFIPLPERETFWQRFKGTQGKRLDKTAYE